MNKGLGVTLYTVRDFCQTIEDFDTTCKRIADIGYKFVQLSGIGDFTGEQIREILDKYGLKAVCTHRKNPNYLENLESEIEFHEKIGAKICGIGGARDVTDGNIEAFLNDFTPVVNELAKKGYMFTYHNHQYEFTKYDGKFALDILIEASENFKLLFDVYYASVVGVNPAKFIRKHAGSIPCVHFKDYKIVEKQGRFAEVGQGNLDWDDIIAACEESGVEYVIVEQDLCYDTDPFESLKISYDFLKQKGFD